MVRQIVGVLNGYGRPNIKIRVNNMEVSAAFNIDGFPDGISIFTKQSPTDDEYSKNITDSLFGEESQGSGEIPFSDFEDLLRIINTVTST